MPCVIGYSSLGRRVCGLLDSLRLSNIVILPSSAVVTSIYCLTFCLGWGGAGEVASLGFRLFGSVPVIRT